MKKSNINIEELVNVEVNKIKEAVITVNDDRVYDFLDDIREKYKDKRILIVSHGGISIPVKCYFKGIPDVDNLFPLCIDNCEIVEFK
ncbi:MAG: histidine phosphatase family protein [Clostridia bacterium]|jgi:broad specificity phosphatase PhoE|nr:histidine phosphatase family protein [Clostridia bacterium]